MIFHAKRKILCKRGFLMPSAVLQMRQYPHLQASKDLSDY